MRKIFHESLHDWAKPHNVTEPVPVMRIGCAFSEIKSIVNSLLKKLAPFNGNYQLALEFTEPITDARFNVGYVGAQITVRAETEELARQMRTVLP